MTQDSNGRDAFVEYLEKNREDRAMLAELRRGLGQLPGAVPEVSKHVQRRLAKDSPAYLEEAYYIIGPLFALHPKVASGGNMGAHLAAIEPGKEPPDNVTRRFMALLAAHPDDLAEYLRHAVSLLKAKEVPVNWAQLLKDVLAWKSRDERSRLRIQKEWARGFWRTDK